MTRKPLHLHIGYPRTGTTSLQTDLKLNEARLAAAGILLPASHRRRHRYLQAIGAAHINPVVQHAARASTEAEARANALAWLDDVARQAAAFDHVVMSEETVSGKSLAELRTFHQHLSALFNPIHVHVTFRPHLSFLVSEYSQRVRVTFTAASFATFLQSAAQRPILAYASRMDDLISVFGATSVNAYGYARGLGGSNDRILDAMGCSPHITPQQDRNDIPLNSISREGALLKAALNATIQPLFEKSGIALDPGADREFNRGLADLLNTAATHADDRLSDRAAETFRANAALTEIWDADWHELTAGRHAKLFR